MPKQTKRYERLPGSGLKMAGWASFLVGGGRCRLYLAKDHLLQVESQAGYVETYKRFYLSDIQSVQLRRTRQYLVQAVVLGLSLAGVGLSAYGVNIEVREDSARFPLIVFQFILLGILMIYFVKNLIQGPTCTCYFMTAVQLEQIPSMGRFWRARRVLRRLKPLIEESQSPSPSQNTDSAPDPIGLTAAPTSASPGDPPSTE
jgi:hypothetical protein